MPMGGGSGSGGAGGLVKLQTVTRASTGSLDTGASAIPVGHGHLWVVFVCRTAVAATTESYTLRFNGDSGANYDSNYQQGSTAGSSNGLLAQTSVNIGAALTGNTAAANYVSTLILDIPYYDNTNWFKVGSLQINVGQTAAGDTRTVNIQFGWRSTAAINQITLDTASHFLTNSVMTVYSAQ